MKKVGIMQPYFAPYLGYWQHIKSVDCFALYDDVNFIKRGWINRNRIISDGKEKLFSLPLKNISQNRLIMEHQFVDDLGKKKLWNQIDSAYRKAAEYDNVSKMIKDIILYESQDIVDYIYNSTVKICDFLNINTSIIRSSDVKNDKGLKAQDKIIDICKMLDAECYINPSGGVDFYDDQLFSDNDIRLRFIKPHLKEYKQMKVGFISGLSIIDILFCVSRDDILEMLDDYEILTKQQMMEE